MEEQDICNKFPRVCKCPYKEDIDKDFKNGKTAYYVCKWLKKTEYTISYTALKKYYDYLLENGEITFEQKQGSPSHHEEDLLTKLEQKAQKAINNLDMDGLSDNVKVQFILGAYKILYGNKHQVNMAADINHTKTAQVHIDENTLGVLSDAITRRNTNRTK